MGLFTKVHKTSLFLFQQHVHHTYFPGNRVVIYLMPINLQLLENRFHEQLTFPKII